VSRLYLIRHARPQSNWGGEDADPGLAEVGRDQALAARDWLLGLPMGERPARIVSSPLRRCRETAQPTAEALGVGIEIDPAVGEIPAPRGLVGRGRAEWLMTAFQGSWGEIAGDLDYGDWRRRTVAAVLGRGDCAVFSHYVAINAVVSHLQGDERVESFRPDHASITILETDGARLSLIAKGREAATKVL
jgi:broad specificity phosphatase PhoE